MIMEKKKGATLPFLLKPPTLLGPFLRFLLLIPPSFMGPFLHFLSCHLNSTCNTFSRKHSEKYNNSTTSTLHECHVIVAPVCLTVIKDTFLKSMSMLK